MNSSKYLTELNIYPVKSCRGNSLNSVNVGAKGPGLDRRWMIVDSKGVFMSQRQYPKMSQIHTSVDHEHLIISIPESASIHLPIDSKISKSQSVVTVWKDTCISIDQGNEIADALSRFLEVSCRLVYMPDTSFRQVNQNYALRDSDDVGFSDGYPFLLISEASLEDLNSRLETPVPMNRFRPNLVVSGCEPYEEDTWEMIKIGEIVFQVAKPCSRCVVTTIDQTTAQRSLEPLKTLASYRKQEKGIMFGQNLIHQNLGILNLRDKLEVLIKARKC